VGLPFVHHAVGTGEDHRGTIGSGVRITHSRIELPVRFE